MGPDQGPEDQQLFRPSQSPVPCPMVSLPMAGGGTGCSSRSLEPNPFHDSMMCRCSGIQAAPAASLRDPGHTGNILHLLSSRWSQSCGRDDPSTSSNGGSCRDPAAGAGMLRWPLGGTGGCGCRVGSVGYPGTPRARHGPPMISVPWLGLRGVCCRFGCSGGAQGAFAVLEAARGLLAKGHKKPPCSRWHFGAELSNFPGFQGFFPCHR